MFYLIQYIQTSKKGKYEPITKTGYPTAMDAFQAGMAQHKAIGPGNYVGFVVKDAAGNTIHRIRKGV